MSKLLTQLRVIRLPVLNGIDRLCLLLSLIYAGVGLFWKQESSMPTILLLVSVHLFTYLAKIIRQPLYSAFACSLIALSVCLTEGWFAAYPAAAACLVIGAFLLVLLGSVDSAAASGFVYGFWLMMLYLMIRDGMEGTLRNMVFTLFSDRLTLEALSHWPFCLIMAGLMWLFAERTPAPQRTFSQSLAPFLVWMCVLFICAALEGFARYEPSIVREVIIYACISLLVYRSVMNDERLSAALAYAGIAFIICREVREVWEISDFYFTLYVPVIVLILVYVTKMTAHLALGLMVGWWLVWAWSYMQAGTPEGLPSLYDHLELSSLFRLALDAWPVLLVCGLLLERRWVIPFVVTRLKKLRNP
jgi:hypothetical protein